MTELLRTLAHGGILAPPPRTKPRAFHPRIVVGLSPNADRAQKVTAIVNAAIQDFNEDAVNEAARAGGSAAALLAALGAGSLGAFVSALANVTRNPARAAKFANDWFAFKDFWEGSFGVSGVFAGGVSSSGESDIFDNKVLNESFNGVLIEYDRLFHAFTDPTADGGLNLTTSAHTPFNLVDLVVPDAPDAPALPPQEPAKPGSKSSSGGALLLAAGAGLGIIALFALSK